MADVRMRWLLGLGERRTPLGVLGLAAVLLLLALAALTNPQPGPALRLLLLAGPPLAGVAYAAWNGGPLVAVAATQAGAAVAVAQRVLGAPPDPAYAVLALPAGLAAFAVGAWRAHRALGGPPPLGEGFVGASLLALWFAAVVALAVVVAHVPEAALGPRVAPAPWVAWARTAALWGPAGVAIGWAIVRRGPVLAFALATTHLWARYLAEWAGPAARNAGALHLGELLLPPAIDPLRGVAAIALGLLAVGLAMAFEPAWPWLPYRQHAQPGQQV